MNKIDLKLNNSYMDDVIKISAKNNEGIEDIKDAIKELFNVGAFMSKNLTFFTNVRQISLLKSAIKSLEDVQQGIKEEREIDMIEIDLKLISDIVNWFLSFKIVQSEQLSFLPK